MDRIIRTIAPDEHILIGGDLNGHVGSNRGGYPQCHGGQGLGVRNDDGIRILDFAAVHDLAVTNTFFKPPTPAADMQLRSTIGWFGGETSNRSRTPK